MLKMQAFGRLDDGSVVAACHRDERRAPASA